MKAKYVCPKNKSPLIETEYGLKREDGFLYPFVSETNKIPNFIISNELGKLGRKSLDIYDKDFSIDRYRNFLDWLFQTFDEEESSFRRHLVEYLCLKTGDRVLITGCGLGDDITPIGEFIGEGQIYAQDLSTKMILTAYNNFYKKKDLLSEIYFSICNAIQLPFPNNFFDGAFHDGAFHFGGINLFDDIKSSIYEMARVVKIGGKVVFADEGIAPWLKDTEYGKIVITNNPLWSHSPPIEVLPINSRNVNLTWVLGNCFYLISFEIGEKEPFINMDVPHKGIRGGSMRSRYFGQLEGVTEDAKKIALERATAEGISLHDWLDKIIKEKR